MGLETFTNIASLNALWPLGTDAKAEGDDHIRGIKQVLKNEFPTGGVSQTASLRNRIVNGAMQISQENGNTAGTTSLYYAADQWQNNFGATGVISFQRVQVTSANGSRNRLRAVVTTADTTLTSGDNCQITHRIEGIRMADFQWGLSTAKQVILRFGWRSPAGTWGVALKNGAQDRSYVINFTISAAQANTDTTQTFVIPGDSTGTWASDNTIGMFINWQIASNPAAQTATLNQWIAGNLSGTTANTNGFATVNNTFEIFDCGLYLDANNTGVAPAWEMPDEAAELIACMRYWELQYNVLVIGTGNRTQRNCVPKRIVPTISCTPGSGSGATWIATGVNGWFQGAAHSGDTQGNLILNARM